MKTLFSVLLVLVVLASFATAQAASNELTRVEALRALQTSLFTGQTTDTVWLPLFTDPQHTLMWSEIELRHLDKLYKPWVDAGLMSIESRAECSGCMKYPGAFVDFTPKGNEQLAKWCKVEGAKCTTLGIPRVRYPMWWSGASGALEIGIGPRVIDRITGITYPEPNRAVVEFSTKLSPPNEVAKALGYDAPKAAVIEFVKYDDGWRIDNDMNHQTFKWR